MESVVQSIHGNAGDLTSTRLLIPTGGLSVWSFRALLVHPQELTADAPASLGVHV